jgi:hypothetical protein
MPAKPLQRQARICLSSGSATRKKLNMIKNHLRLRCALFGASMVIGFAEPALAQPASSGDPTRVEGKVAQYLLTPSGELDGMILTDGTEVCLPPHLSTQLVFAVRPGDAVTIQGVKSVANPVVTAVAITNDGTGAVVDMRPPGSPQQLDDESRIKLQLHDPAGYLNGVLLEDGAIVRMPQVDADQDAAGLAVGQPLYVRGEGVSSPLGKVIAAREIGPAKSKLIEVDVSRFERWKNDLFGGGDSQRPIVPPPAPAAPKT